MSPKRLRFATALESLVLALSVVFVAAGCGSPDKASDSSVPLLPLESVEATWMWRLAFDPSLDDGLVARLSGRWLGAGDSSWAPLVLEPTTPQSPNSEVLRRERAENAEALEIFGEVYLDAACTLGQSPHAYGQHVPLGYRIGEAACAALGDKEASGRAGALLKKYGARQSGGATAGSLRHPLTEKAEVEGEQLIYRFYGAEAFTEAARALRAGTATTSPASSGLAARVGTSQWSAGSIGDLLGSADILADSSAAGDLGQLERTAEESLAVLRRALETHGSKAPEPLGPAELSLLLSWARRAIYRDLGLEALRSGHFDVALPLLEEAAGSSGRLQPGPGRDPLLLAAVAKARYKNNQGLRTVDLLRTISRQKGWEHTAVIAELVARREVLPSEPRAEVRR